MAETSGPLVMIEPEVIAPQKENGNCGIAAFALRMAIAR